MSAYPGPLGGLGADLNQFADSSSTATLSFSTSLKWRSAVPLAEGLLGECCIAGLESFDEDLMALNHCAQLVVRPAALEGELGAAKSLCDQAPELESALGFPLTSTARRGTSVKIASTSIRNMRSISASPFTIHGRTAIPAA